MADYRGHVVDYRLREYRMYKDGKPTLVVIVATTWEVEIINREIQHENREYRLRETEYEKQGNRDYNRGER